MLVLTANDRSVGVFFVDAICKFDKFQKCLTSAQLFKLPFEASLLMRLFHNIHDLHMPSLTRNTMKLPHDFAIILRLQIIHFLSDRYQLSR